MSWSYSDNHITIYTCIKSTCFTPYTYTMLHVKSSQLKKKQLKNDLTFSNKVTYTGTEAIQYTTGFSDLQFLFAFYLCFSWTFELCFFFSPMIEILKSWDPLLNNNSKTSANPRRFTSVHCKRLGSISQHPRRTGRNNSKVPLIPSVRKLQ